MNVFLTGATGVLGRSVSRMLVDTGHHVRALARNSANELRLREAGIEPVRGNLFEFKSLCDAMKNCDAVLHLATHIPPSNQAGNLKAWQENDRIRREGTRNLVHAALDSDVTTFIYPSVVFVYPDGADRWQEAPSIPQPTAILESTVTAEGEVEQFTRAGKRGIVLRMGGLYGPAAQSTRDMLRTACHGIAMVFGRAAAYQPMIWIDDAALAVVDALSKAPAGTYDIVDDEPLQRRDLARAIADAIGRKWIFRLPTFLLWVMGGTHLMFMARSQRVSNRRFKEATGWSPTVASARLGLKLTAIEP